MFCSAFTADMNTQRGLINSIWSHTGGNHLTSDQISKSSGYIGYIFIEMRVTNVYNIRRGKKEGRWGHKGCGLMVPQDCRPKLPTTTILDALQTLSQHFPNASIHYTNHNLKPPHPILYKTKTRGLLHNNPCLNGLQAFSKLSKTIPVNFPTAILEVHFMRPKLPEIWFHKIGLTTEKSDIRASAINEKSVNLPLAKYLLAHIRPKIVQRLQPPKIFPRQWWWKPT